MKYRTIVADPPWPYGVISAISYRKGAPSGEPRMLPYPEMSLDAIKAVPVAEFADRNAHLYLWTTQRFMRESYDVLDAWGFKPAAIIVWSKPPRGISGTYICSAEFALFARRGSLKPLRKQMGTVFDWPRVGSHSAKPEAFLDMVERVSPGPYVEMFARRARFGWDYWGNESLETAEVAA